MKNAILGFIVCLFLGNTGWAQQMVWVPANPAYVMVQAQPSVVVVPVYVVQPYYYGWNPCWKRWWVPYQYQPVYYHY